MQALQGLIDSLMQALAEGDLALARRRSLSLIVHSPGEPLGWKAYGVVMHLQGDILVALLILERAIRLQPEDSESHYNLGLSLQQLGRHDDAEAVIQAAIHYRPDYAEARSNLAVSLKALGKFQEAVCQTQAAVILNPAYSDALNNLGMILHGMSIRASAVWAYKRALHLDPASPHLLNNLGICLHEMGVPEEAEWHCRAALQINSAFAEAHNNLGVILKAQGLGDAARHHTRCALMLNPAYADAHNNLAVLFYEQQDHAASERASRRALSLRPDYAEAWNNLGNALHGLGQLTEAEAAFCNALGYRQNYAEAHSNKAVLLYKHGKSERAHASIRRAVILEPGYAEAWCNLGAITKDHEGVFAAETAFWRAIKIRPAYPEAFNNLGIAYHDQGLFQKAIDAYDEAIRLDEGHALARRNQSLVNLLLGRFDEGMEGYEWRFKDPEARVTRREPVEREWSGRLDLEGKTILLYAEQGLGDTLQFCRYAGVLVRYGARIILEVQEPLVVLLADLWDGVEVIAQGAMVPSYDWHCALMSVPRFFGMDPVDIPFKEGYLRASAQKLDHWREVLGPQSKPRIGICCSGHPSHDNDHNRSIPLHQFKSIMSSRADYFLLQKEVRASDIPELEDSSNIVVPEIKDYDDTASLITLMDLIITVDTSIAHLSGALGRPAWVFLPWVPDWRWRLDRIDSDWYSSLRLFRQPERQVWSKVLNQVHSLMNVTLKLSSGGQGHI